MIDTKEFTRIKRELEKNEAAREKDIQESRMVIKVSKQIIYSLHRGDIKKAETQSKDIKARVKKLRDMNLGMCRVAIQEYVEAIAYLHFLNKGTLITMKESGVDYESYLLGLCDLTGELVRKAVNEVIQGNESAAYLIKELVAGIYEQFLRLDLRNGELRKKADSIRWNLNKIEDIIYKLEIR